MKMKKKRLFSALLLVAVLVAGLMMAGCSQSVEDKVIGKWKVVSWFYITDDYQRTDPSVIADLDGKCIEATQCKIDELKQVEIELKADGRGTYSGFSGIESGSPAELKWELVEATDDDKEHIDLTEPYGSLDVRINNDVGDWSQLMMLDPEEDLTYWILEKE